MLAKSQNHSKGCLNTLLAKSLVIKQSLKNLNTSFFHHFLSVKVDQKIPTCCPFCFAYSCKFSFLSSPMVQFQLLHSKFPLCASSTRGLLMSTYVKFINLFPEIKGHIQEVRNSYLELTDDKWCCHLHLGWYLEKRVNKKKLTYLAYTKKTVSQKQIFWQFSKDSRHCKQPIKFWNCLWLITQYFQKCLPATQPRLLCLNFLIHSVFRFCEVTQTSKILMRRSNRELWSTWNLVLLHHQMFWWVHLLDVYWSEFCTQTTLPVTSWLL